MGLEGRGCARVRLENTAPKTWLRRTVELSVDNRATIWRDATIASRSDYYEYPADKGSSRWQMDGRFGRREHQTLGGEVALGFWQRFAPCTLRLGDLGPHFAEDLETPKASLIECPHVRRIAVIEFFKNVTHR